MTNLNWKFDAERQQFTAQFVATVVSLGTTTQTNVNGTNYFVGSVSFKDAKGVTQTRSAICYEANAEKGIEVGGEYIINVTATKDRPNEPILSISPLTGAVRASAADFNFDYEKMLATANVGAEEVNA